MAHSRSEKERRTLCGHRFLILAVDWTPMQVTRAIRACEALCPAEVADHQAVPAAAAVLVADRTTYAAAINGEREGSGVCMLAAGHHYWTCDAGYVLERQDAWLFAAATKVRFSITKRRRRLSI